MKFAAPQYLWLLLVVLPLLGAFFFWSWRVKQKLVTQFISARLLANLTVGVSPARQKLRIGLIIAAVVFLFIALARPQWGYAWEEAKQQGLDIVVAIDTSRSMLAEDVTPNRLSRAKLAALDLMKQAKNDRLGLVSFAGTAFLQSPLTLDEEAFRQSVDSLDVGIIPQGGTALAEAINTALTAFEKEDGNHKILILFTDGEDHEGDTQAIEAAEAAAKAGMKIFTIGVGTAEGEMLRTRDEQGNSAFIKDDEDHAIKSHLNETLLQKIATAADGFYLPLRGASPMEMLYDKGLKPLPKSDAMTKQTRVYHERFRWPLALALACLIFETLLPERKKPAASAILRSQSKTAAVALCLLLLPLAGMASPSSALRQYNSGKFDAAFDEYQRLSERKTNDYRLHYNAGTTAYQAKQFESAQKHLNAALISPEMASDLPTQQRAYYNLANTEFELGAPAPDPKKKKELWEQAVENYIRALRLNAKDTNANNNLAFVRRKLEELKQQEQKQQDKKDKSKDQDDKNQDQKDQKDQQDKKDQKDQKSDKQKQQDSKDQNGKDQKKSDQEKQKQEQAKKDKEKQDKKDQAAQDDQKDKSPEQADKKESQAAGQMSLEQAKRILDAQREDEKALIFRPENDPKKQQDRKFKDW